MAELIDFHDEREKRGIAPDEGFCADCRTELMMRASVRKIEARHVRIALSHICDRKHQEGYECRAARY
jgi:hypothetical protein